MFNRLEWLSQKFEEHAGTNMILFMHWLEISVRQKGMYIWAVCDIIPHKTKTHWLRLATGRNLIKYSGNIRTLTAELTLKKNIQTYSYPDKEEDIYVWMRWIFSSVNIQWANMNTSVSR